MISIEKLQTEYVVCAKKIGRCAPQVVMCVTPTHVASLPTCPDYRTTSYCYYYKGRSRVLTLNAKTTERNQNKIKRMCQWLTTLKGMVEMGKPIIPDVR